MEWFIHFSQRAASSFLLAAHTTKAGRYYITIKISTDHKLTYLTYTTKVSFINEVALFCSLRFESFTLCLRNYFNSHSHNLHNRPSKYFLRLVPPFVNHKDCSEFCCKLLCIKIILLRKYTNVLEWNLHCKLLFVLSKQYTQICFISIQLE